MHYHIILTTQCNSQCKYCYEKSMNDFDVDIEKKVSLDLSAPETSIVNINKLKKFVGRDKNPVLIFYGGEPLLQINKIKEIMDNIEVPYRMQTNGKLLGKLPIEYLKRIDKILVSIDGNKEKTDENRGKGTYKLLMKNVSLIKQKGYKGEIIARMTLGENSPDIYEQVLHLIGIGFSSIHWQIDAGFYAHDFDKQKFSLFVNEYNNSITKLIDYWIENMKNKRVLKFYPFIGIVDSLLKNEKTKLRCGAGHSGYAIRTDGKLMACPIMTWIGDFISGDLDSNPDNLKEFPMADRCRNCNIKFICGGRCLYWNYLKLWPEEGNQLICNTIEHLVNSLKNRIPEIKKLISEDLVSYKDFEYEKYFGPEIIP
ncbi:MAG: 7-carboxy-7-deazaguanine synthase [Candidatus Methanofastidiosum methylothiophilum]|uniref:7-carboxy-7-deazaguanine synthase n=1 Tax=Candidatus Methanofastidiosum methylothiophilum TaxID=1705564 RepID=A0A150IXP4_9EURY|nr:MAG: 7-carboxy-7-deazaguanine synthase [Candidatus Methanofastidiosum methylthiophilus]KYC47304.1 MAG: 7-carboxy-7-deazaguanine synthase [Candidatus Methanofastidiosum methylthiophilus]KYC49739.1 MAG: 7-carboxy-7-deazaguanine synthase [Candidatus Methanofastidiosum methylthiophilus]